MLPVLQVQQQEGVACRRRERVLSVQVQAQVQKLGLFGDAKIHAKK